MENLNRECQSYLWPGVASSTCFRKLYEVVDTSSEAAAGDKYVALEWLDTTLAQMKYQPGKDTYVLIEKVLSAALHSCLVLESYDCVDTGMDYECDCLKPHCSLLTSLDYRPANILLSGIGTSQITANVGDLGLGMRLSLVYEAMYALTPCSFPFWPTLQRPAICYARP